MAYSQWSPALLCIHDLDDFAKHTIRKEDVHAPAGDSPEHRYHANDPIDEDVAVVTAAPFSNDARKPYTVAVNEDLGPLRQGSEDGPVRTSCNHRHEADVFGNHTASNSSNILQPGAPVYSAYSRIIAFLEASKHLRGSSLRVTTAENSRLGLQLTRGGHGGPPQPAILALASVPSARKQGSASQLLFSTQVCLRMVGCGQMVVTELGSQCHVVVHWAASISKWAAKKLMLCFSAATAPADFRTAATPCALVLLLTGGYCSWLLWCIRTFVEMAADQAARLHRTPREQSALELQLPSNIKCP